MTLAERPLGRGQKPIHLFLASDDRSYADDLSEYLQTNPVDLILTTVSEKVSEVLAAPTHTPATVLLLDAGLLAKGWQEHLDAIIAAGFARVILLVSDLGNAPVSRPDIDVIFKYSLGSSLVQRIRSLPERHSPERAAMAENKVVPVSTTKPVVIGLYSPRGGAGSSTLAANLAFLYASKGLKVALADLARNGAQHVILRQSQRGQGLSSLITLLTQEPAAVGTERMATYLQQALHKVEQGKTQFHLLPAAQPARMDQIAADPVRLLLEQLPLAGFQVVLVDLSAEMAERIRAALTVATRIVVPVLPEVVSAWHALQLRDTLPAGQRERLAFVVNRQRSDAGFDPEEFMRLGGVPMLGSIPDDDRYLCTDLAAGRLTATRSTSQFTKALTRVAHALYPVFEPRELAQGRWPWSK